MKSLTSLVPFAPDAGSAGPAGFNGTGAPFLQALQLLPAVLGTLGLLVACGDGDDSTGTDVERGPAPPTRGAGQATVVLVVIDSARPDHLTPYGYELDTTPNLAEIAAEGAVFADCVTPCTGTNGGLASLLVGKLASEHGVGSLTETGRQRLPDEEETLAERFRAAGFGTFAAVALPQLGPLSGFDQGFDTYRAPHPRESARDARQVFLDARPGLDALLARDAPAFVLLHLADARSRDAAPSPAGTRFVEPHLRPHADDLEGVGEILDSLRGDPEGALDELVQKLGRARGSEAYLALGAALYDGRLAFVDEQVGGLVALLKERGRWDDAFVAVLSTRGAVLTPPRSTGGPAFLPELVRVPMIVRAPGTTRETTARLVQAHDLHATLSGLFELGDSDAIDLFGPVSRSIARAEDASFARRAGFGPSYFMEDDVRGAAVFERSGAFVPRPAELTGAAALEVGALEVELARWDRPWARLTVTAGAEDDDSELAVSWRLFDGFTRSARIADLPLADLRPNTLKGVVILAGGQRLDVVTSRRDAPVRLSLRWLGRDIDERAVFLGDRPLAELLVPRVPAGAVPWPEETPAEVDLKRHSGSWWKLVVGAEGAAGREVEVLFTVCPPPDVKVLWSAGSVARSERVAGRADAARLFGVTPFEVELQRKPGEDLALAVAIDGRVVPASEMRASGHRFAPLSEVDLYLPDWLAGVTDSLASEGPEPAAGRVLLRRGVPAVHVAASDLELELLQHLSGDE